METVTLLNIEDIRKEFPLLSQEINGHPLIYFDNAATTQKPKQVIDAITEYYQNYNANIHRGVHTLAQKATEAYEETRKAIQKFVNAPEAEEIIFTKGTTDGINLIAATYGRKFLKAGDEVIISSLEHHSNIVPWHMLCEEKEAILKVIPINSDGDIIIEEFQKLLSSKTKIVAIGHVSNTLGTINPIDEVIRMAHGVGAVVLIDGAQAASHLEIDVQKSDVDFYAFSGHKMYGPTGIGALYGKRTLLESMPPYQGGGEMIQDVCFEKSTYGEIPYKFEAGTPNIADAIALKMAIEFINGLGKINIAEQENDLLKYGHERLSAIQGLRIIGTAKKKVGVISFVIDGLHHFDIGTLLDARGIAVRTGLHCTQPLLNLFKLDGTVRASFAVYNTKQEIDKLAEGLERIVKLRK